MMNLNHNSPFTAINSRRPRLALAINDEERRVFVEPHLQRLLAAVEIVNTDTSQPADFDTLLGLEPEILLTAWSTPSIKPLLAQPAHSLKYICHLMGSVRNIVPRAFIEQGGQVTNWGTLPAVAVAEHALLLTLAILRNLPAWASTIAGPRHSPATRARALATRTLAGRQVGIHGFGGVAQALVRLLRPFDVAIRGFSAGVPPEFMKAHGVEPCSSLSDLFSQSEVLYECEALTPETRGSISARELSLLNDYAVFINVARGDLVDEDALIREASTGRIHVALDVVSTEPITPQSTLFNVPGVLLSPHIAGPTFSQFPKIGDLAAGNIERYAARHPLQALVTLEIFDRST